MKLYYLITEKINSYSFLQYFIKKKTDFLFKMYCSIYFVELLSESIKSWKTIKKKEIICEGEAAF